MRKKEVRYLKRSANHFKETSYQREKGKFGTIPCLTVRDKKVLTSRGLSVPRRLVWVKGGEGN